MKRTIPGLLALRCLLLALVALCGCAGDDSGAGGLPPNPADWVCPDSLAGATQAEIDAWCAAHPDRGQPLPEALRNPRPLEDLEEKNLRDLALEVFVKAAAYKRELGWLGDTMWRFTGPYVGDIGSGENYGTHLPVRIYYSPEVVDWLCEGRQGDLPEGAMIIKEMHLPDQNLDVSLDDEGCMVINADARPEAWAMMIKNSQHSFDHWYWPVMQRSQFPLYPEERVDPPVVDRSAFPSQSFVTDAVSSPDPAWYPTGYDSEDPNKIPNVITPQNLYGTFCFACHASAAQDFTFASLDNLIGKPIRYKQFEAGDGDTASGINGTHVLAFDDVTSAPESSADGYNTPFTVPLADADPAFLQFYDQLSAVPFTEVWQSRLPAETYDHVRSSPDGPQSFLTSDQCSPCHDVVKYLADEANMLLRLERDGKEVAVNLSPYGEWNASPMGLAGRDPIFFAQLQGETNQLRDLADCIESTCLQCHGVMGERQLATDTPGETDPRCEELVGVAPPPGVPSGRPFRLRTVAQWPGAVERLDQRYGALARDGISCTVCHRISVDSLGSESSFTGNFVTGPLDEIYGPYADVSTKPMQNALGVTPQHGDQIASADLCGSCHNILLPVFTNEGVRTGFAYEQTTHLEWLNSDYAIGGRLQQTCQDCHMPRTFEGLPLSFEIANFESDQFPPTTYRLPDDEINASVRDRYSRHSLHGLNAFLNQMFQQFPLLLGYRQAERFTRTSLDYPPLLLAEDSILEMATTQTADIEVTSLATRGDGTVVARIRVTNRAGHDLPSGVGFRRAFLEVVVRDGDGEILWASGRTNELGAIVDGATERVLPTEMPLEFPEPGYQPHYQVITRQDQVQIYQEIVEDSDGDVTTSFLRRFTEVKDNRIRPVGYDPRFYETFDSPYIRALAQIPGQEKDDPDYFDPRRTGADEIEYHIALGGAATAAATIGVTLYSQSIPPPYLAERFEDAGRGAAEKDHIERLYYMTSHFRADGALAGWKLALASTARKLSN